MIDNNRLHLHTLRGYASGKGMGRYAVVSDEYHYVKGFTQ